MDLLQAAACCRVPDRWAFRLVGCPDACYGLSDSQLDDLYASCDVLLNVVGATDLREEQLQAPFRIYVQTDPVTAELRLANGDEHTREAFDNHHVIATYGENYKRLALVKAQYDPENLFRVNQNIAPAAG